MKGLKKIAKAIRKGDPLPLNAPALLDQAADELARLKATQTLRIDHEWLRAAARGQVISIATDEGTVMQVILEES